MEIAKVSYAPEMDRLGSGQSKIYSLKNTLMDFEKWFQEMRSLQEGAHDLATKISCLEFELSNVKPQLLKEEIDSNTATSITNLKEKILDLDTEMDELREKYFAKISRCEEAMQLLGDEEIVVKAVPKDTQMSGQELELSVILDDDGQLELRGLRFPWNQ